VLASAKELCDGGEEIAVGDAAVDGLCGEREVAQERQCGLSVPIRVEAAELLRRGTVEGAAEREGLELPAVGEDVGEELVVHGNVACEMEVREVADGDAVCREDPMWVVDVYRA